MPSHRIDAWQLSQRLPKFASCTGAWQPTQAAPREGATRLPRSWHFVQTERACPLAKLSHGWALPLNVILRQSDSEWQFSQVTPSFPACGSLWQLVQLENSSPRYFGGLPRWQSAHLTVACAPRSG